LINLRSQFHTIKQSRPFILIRRLTPS